MNHKLTGLNLYSRVSSVVDHVCTNLKVLGSVPSLDDNFESLKHLSPIVVHNFPKEVVVLWLYTKWSQIFFSDR